MIARSARSIVAGVGARGGDPTGAAPRPARRSNTASSRARSASSPGSHSQRSSTPSKPAVVQLVEHVERELQVVVGERVVDRLELELGQCRGRVQESGEQRLGQGSSWCGYGGHRPGTTHLRAVSVRDADGQPRRDEGPDLARQARRPRRHRPRPERSSSPTDAIIRVTSTGLCGSDLHLYEVLGPFIDEGDILGHEPMGIVEAVGAEVPDLAPGDRVVIPFNISCGHCCMCDHGPADAVRDDPGPRAGHGRRAVRLHQALRRRSPAARPSSCACRRRTTGRSRSPRARRTTASCSSPTCCRPRGRPCSTPTSRGRQRRRHRPRPDRRDGLRSPSTSAPARHRARPRARAARARGSPRRADDRRQRGRRRRRRRPRADRRARPGRGDRRRRHGGPRRARAASSRTRSPG